MISPHHPSTAVYPNFDGVGGEAILEQVIGALLTIALIVAVLMLIVCAITWAVASSHGNIAAATKARTGVFVSLSGAALCGAAMTWLNFLLHMGATL
jgi:hypothetical protein